MWVKDISFETPQENILYDEVLYHLAETGQGTEGLRFWESALTFVVLGRIGKLEEDVRVENVRKDKISILRRASGGGTVLQGKGCLNYTLILSKASKEVKDLKRSYQYILGNVVAALRTLGIEADYFPISDIALKSSRKKISGNAQKRGKHAIMHHGTFLVDFDLSLIEKYLTLPKDMPEYRQQRNHLAFVSNLKVPVQKLKVALGKVFKADEEHKSISAIEEQCLNEFLSSKDILIRV